MFVVERDVEALQVPVQAVIGEGGAPAAALTTQAISPEPPTAAKDDVTPAPSKTKRLTKPSAPKAGDWKGTVWQGGSN